MNIQKLNIGIFIDSISNEGIVAKEKVTLDGNVVINRVVDTEVTEEANHPINQTYKVLNDGFTDRLVGATNLNRDDAEQLGTIFSNWQLSYRGSAINRTYEVITNAEGRLVIVQ